MTKVFEFEEKKYVTTPLGIMSYKWFIENRNLLGFYYKKETSDWVFLTQKAKAYSTSYQGKLEQADINIPIRFYNMKIAIWKAQKKLDKTKKFEEKEIYHNELPDDVLEMAKGFGYGDRYIPEENMCKNYNVLCKELDLKEL
jgi:hypothetical protein